MMTKKKEQKLNDEIALLRHEIADLKEIVKTQELIKLRAENQRLKEIERMVGNLKIQLKDVAYIPEENVVLVKYQVPNIKVNFNSEGKVIKNEMFYAINKLRLMSFEDMAKIQAVLDNVQNNS